MGTRFWRATGLVTVGLAAAFAFGPAVVNAGPNTASDVKIIDRDTTNRADVSSKHRLLTDTEAATTDLGGDNFLDVYGLQFTEPNGQAMLAQGTNGCLVDNNGAVVLASVNINVNTALTSPLTVTVQDHSSIPVIAYKTTYATGEVGSHDFSFDGGVFFDTGFKVVATSTGGAVDCQVVGQDLGALGSPQRHAPGK